MDDNNLTHNKLRIRDYDMKELDDISRLIRDTFQEYESYFPSKGWQPLLQEITDVRSRLRDSKLIVAELEKRLVGSVTLYLETGSVDQLYLDSHPSDHGWPKGWAVIRLLAVHPKTRHIGIGRALMEECVRRSRACGISTIGLHTTKFMDVARQMYERMGFVRVPEFDFHPGPHSIVVAYRLNL